MHHCKTRYCLIIYIYIHSYTLEEVLLLNIYNPTDNEISLKVYNMHLYYDHTLYSLQYAPIL